MPAFWSGAPTIHSATQPIERCFQWNSRFPWNLNPGIIRILCGIKILRAAFRGGICCSPRLLLSGTVNDSKPRPSTFHRNSLIQTINTAMYLSGFSNTFWWERLAPMMNLLRLSKACGEASVTLPHKFLMCVKNDFSLASHVSHLESIRLSWHLGEWEWERCLTSPLSLDRTFARF